MDVSLIDKSAMTVVTTLGGGAITSLLVIALIGYAVLRLIESNRGQFNPYLHMPHPPDIEHRPQQGLPPPSQAYADWSAEKDKTKDHAPWDR